MMKDPSYCYKFYWLEAIVWIISENRKEATYIDIIDKMIANAWYSVLEFHVHLSGISMDGQIKDNIEKAEFFKTVLFLCGLIVTRFAVSTFGCFFCNQFKEKSIESSKRANKKNPKP